MTAYGSYGGTVWKMAAEELCPKEHSPVCSPEYLRYSGLIRPLHSI